MFILNMAKFQPQAPNVIYFSHKKKYKTSGACGFNLFSKFVTTQTQRIILTLS